MKFSKLKILKSSLILLVVILCFTLFVFVIYSKKSVGAYSSIDVNKKHSVDLTGDGLKETIEVTENDNLYDVKITSKKSTVLLSTLLKDNKLCDNITGNIFKLRFINIMRDSKPEILVQGLKDGKTSNYLFYYDKDFKLALENNSNICGVLDSNLNRTPQFISLNYSDKKDTVKSNMLINNTLVDSTRSKLKVPGLDNVIQLIDYVNLDVEVDNHPDIFTDTISSNELSQLWKLDKNTFDYSFKDSFFFDSTLDENGNVIECTYILSFTKKNKKDNSLSPFDVEVKLNKSYYNDLRISEMRFFLQK